MGAVFKAHFKSHFSNCAEMVLQQFRGTVETVVTDIIARGLTAQRPDFPVKGGAAHVELFRQIFHG